MGLVEKFLPLFQVAYVTVILENKFCRVFTKIKKGSSIVDTIDKKFDIKNGEISVDVINHINKYQNKYKFVYIGTLLNSINQGSIKGHRREDFKKFGVVYNNIEKVVIDKSWSVYGFADDILLLKDSFDRQVGIDFILSPFIVLYKVFKSDFSSRLKLYVLCQKGSVALAVFKGNSFLFGAYFSIDSSSETFQTDTDSKGGSNSNNDGDNEELEELVFFEDDEDVIALDDSGEAIESDEDESSEKDDDSVASIEEFNEGVDLFNFIKSAIEEFYKNSKYENEFIESITIANACNLTDEVVTYIKNELMMDINIKDIDIAKTTSKIIEEEVSS